MIANAPVLADVPARLLLGPGPSPVHPRVMSSLAAPVLGHLDPDFARIMGETAALLRYVFQTSNPLTLAISGTGTSGMEAAVVNFVQPGDHVVVGIAGYFGVRLADMCERHGAEVHTIEVPWGEIISERQIEEALRAHAPVRLVALVHAETSTGAQQPLAGLDEIVHRAGALLLVDTVTSLGGCEVRVDDWGIDICYSGSQKCIGAPSGLAPLTVSPRAQDLLAARRLRVPSFYLDLNLLQSYWSSTPTYHHTASSTLVYSLREALRIISEEGLSERFARHTLCARGLWAGLAAMSLKLHAPAAHRLPTLTTVRIPDGVDDARTRRHLLLEHAIEIGGGLGPLKGRVWRIGLMGHGASPDNVLRLLDALEASLRADGHDVEVGAGAAAADGILRGRG